MNATGNAAVSRLEFLKKTYLQTFVFQYIAVDCTWEEWGDWSACPDKCGISTKFRAREKIEHICGGLECKGLGIEEEDCDRFAEVKMEKDQCHKSLNDKLKEIKRLKNKMCQNLDCKNGGTCQEGECLCTNEFTGRRCEEYISSDSIDSDPGKHKIPNMDLRERYLSFQVFAF